jgi:hypothetical protein
MMGPDVDKGAERLHRSDRQQGGTGSCSTKGNQILVSSTTADVVNHSEIEFGDPMTVELKRIAGTHTLLPLSWQN